MACSPELRSDRLVVTPFAEKHLSARYLGWLHDLELLRFSEQRHRRHTLESCRAYWESFLDSPHYFWAIESRADGQHIGNMNAYVDGPNLVADLGIILGEKAFHGQGLGVEAWRLVCGYFFTMAGMRKISAGMLAVNQPMSRLAERAGMVPDGSRHRHCLWDGQEVDIIHYALFHENWKRPATNLPD